MACFDAEGDSRCHWLAGALRAPSATASGGGGRCESASSDCCITSGGAAGCHSCAERAACCGDDPSYDCTAWDVTPGVVGHLDHILLAVSLEAFVPTFCSNEFLKKTKAVENSC